MMLDELIAEAELGEAAKAFLESELGQVILGIAKQEADLALEQLEVVDAGDVGKIRELQNQAWRARSFKQWLVELVNKGENAKQIFKQQQES